MMHNLTKKQIKIVCSTISIWGIILISSGVSMEMSSKPTTTSETKLNIVQKRVAEIKSNEIKLKDITLEINTPLSVNVKDYLENTHDIEENIIKSLKLDTSMVNTSTAGSYTYTISYKNKKFNGTIIIKEKELPETTMTLKSINLEIGSTLSTDLQTYIVETLSEEIKTNTKLDLSNVNTTQSGNYQYSVTYKGKLYTGTITIYQPQKTNNEKPIEKNDNTTTDTDTKQEENIETE